MECTICYNEEKDTVLIPCSHTFCRDCVEQMMAHGGKCAECRGKIRTYCKVRLTTQDTKELQYELYIHMFSFYWKNIKDIDMSEKNVDCSRFKI